MRKPKCNEIKQFAPNHKAGVRTRIQTQVMCLCVPAPNHRAASLRVMGFLFRALNNISMSAFVFLTLKGNKGTEQQDKIKQGSMRRG